MNRIDLSNYNIRSDLIIENDNIKHDEILNDDIKITKSNDNGNYVTISFLDITNYEDREKVGKCLENVIKDILKLNNIKEKDSCLIIGLGNRLSTPDSLGVKVLDDTIVTGHLFTLHKNKKGMRKVSSFVPGVMGNNGIETSRIIKAIIHEIKPDFVIAIDSLAARNIDRINKTIQVTDTGIHPGSGIGNNRVEISKETMGIPVIAIGVPTVMMSSTIVYNTIEYLYKHISYIKENMAINKLSFYKSNYRSKISNLVLSDSEKSNLLGLFGSLDSCEQKGLIDEVLNNTELNLIVTPTEIDFLIDKMSNLIAGSINNALHRQITHY